MPETPAGRADARRPAREQGRDTYRRLAFLYDNALERLIAPLRVIALRVYPPSPGLRVLDLGCGTGAHLERYHEAGCVVAGVDPPSRC